MMYCEAVKYIMCVDDIGSGGDGRSESLTKAFSCGFRLACFNGEIYAADKLGNWIETPIKLKMLEVGR